MNNRLVVLRYYDENPQRIDKFLAARLPELSRSRLQALIRDGLVTLDGQIARKGGQLVDFNTTVEVQIPAREQTQLLPEKIPLDIIFENKDVLVINKPAGIVVHPSAGHSSGTLVHAVLAHAPDIEGIGGKERPGVVHRLDKDTSGIILMAKNDTSHRWLQNQFRAHKAIKTYLALVDGKPPTAKGRVEAPIGRDPTNRKKMAIVPPNKGRQAISEYRSLKIFPKHTLLEVRPITGRTHQIRIHLSFLGCPVVGDRVYGRRHPSLDLDRQFLHAARLDIRLPGEKDTRAFEAPVPKDLERLLEEFNK
ncbi:MAG: RluA family pseudouridine synthase [Anaerolineales bacterium]|nr:RluA family pseudouridine synthase [Anaerolineales bacterium]